MKKFIKNNIIGFILGAVIFSGITGVAAYSIFATDIGYTPSDSTWKKSNGEDITNVKDAIDDLYTKKIFSSISFVGKDSIIGNKTMTYTFNEDVNLGIVVVIGSNATNDEPSYVAEIQSLTTGNYNLLDETLEYYVLSGEIAGHRVRAYTISGVKKDSVLTVATRYSGTVQIFKIN